MASAPSRTKIDYPTSDGKPMAETEVHRDLMMDLIQTLQMDRANDPLFYVSGNLLVFYVEGDRRKHVAPDVFAVRGVPKDKGSPRQYYLIWEEGNGPEVVIELTSRSTAKEDLEHKFRLYRDVLKVLEYFLFDPNAEYLKPPLQGYRLSRGRYVRIKPVKSRLPSGVLGLHLERNGRELRLHNPATGEWLPTPREVRQQAQAEVERLRRELKALKRRLGNQP
jgi:Uma2 family endonuclease